MCKCCYECKDRHEACHDTCEKYQQWKADKKAEEERLKKAKDEANWYRMSRRYSK